MPRGHVRGDESFMRRRTASTATAATIEDAPASSPKGGTRKRAIITYAPKPSKAYRRVNFVTVQRSAGRRGGVLDTIIRSTSPLTPD